MYKTYVEEEKNVDRGIFKEVPLPCAFLDEVALEKYSINYRVKWK